jgi:hypothetical protein
MKRNGRPVDPVFEGSEKLFRRYKSEHIVDGSFTGVGLSFRNAPSVNREKYSRPIDVLFSEAGEFANWGVVSFRVLEIPSPLPPDNPRYELSPKHAPLEENYAHTEVHCEGIPATGYVEPAPAIRKMLRATLRETLIKFSIFHRCSG